MVPHHLLALKALGYGGKPHMVPHHLLALKALGYTGGGAYDTHYERAHGAGG
jgi:hypothetical protein